MATYFKIPRHIPSMHRSAMITDVEEDDVIDLEDLLGRPARGIRFFATDPTDIIVFKLNTLVRLPVFNETRSDETLVVQSGREDYPPYTLEDSLVYDTAPGLSVSSVEIVSLVLSVGTTIEIMAW